MGYANGSLEVTSYIDEQERRWSYALWQSDIGSWYWFLGETQRPQGPFTSRRDALNAAEDWIDRVKFDS